MQEPQRLFFGNPSQNIPLQDFPKGERKAFGEPQATQPTAPILPIGAQVLAFGNSPKNPMPDAPFKVVDGTPQWQPPTT
jgi:hypothetical protein